MSTSEIILSVIIPCRNEEERIIEVLKDLSNQTSNELFEVVVMDGYSQDRTWEMLNEYKSVNSYPYELILLRNEDKFIPHGLNKAVKATRGKKIIRVDGHSHLPIHYIENISRGLDEADVVGPQIVNVSSSSSLTARIITNSLNTRLGNGGTASRNHLTKPLRVEHTVMSCFWREVWEGIDGFDETLLSNEDFDFDYRANKAGYKVYSLPYPKYELVSRSTLKELAKQRWRYGYWKAKVLKKHPASLKLRQLIPLLGVLILIIGIFVPIMLLAFICAYLLIILLNMKNTYVKSNNMIKDNFLKQYFLNIIIHFIIHFVWGLGVWYGLFSKPFAINRKH